MKISDWYPLNVAEGEGLGTSYEYLAKYSHLKKWFTGSESVSLKKGLIAGLPYKYGLSLDFIYLCKELGIQQLIIVDHRLDRLNKLKAVISTNKDRFNGFKIEYQHLDEKLLCNPFFLKERYGRFDLVLNSEVLANWSFSQKAIWFKKLAELTKNACLFIPNGHNQAHNQISKIAAIKKENIEEMVEKFLNGNKQKSIGYCDMPPFPPGISASENQKSSLTDNLLFIYAIELFLQVWLVLERTIFKPLQKQSAHLIYVFLRF